MKILGNLQGHEIDYCDDGIVRWTSKANIDGDGIGPSFGDPCYQADTSYHRNGRPLNANVDRYIALPPLVINGVGPIVLGCQVRARYKGGEWVTGLVGDVGPKSKIGEMSEAFARALGIPWSPNTGGVPAGVEWEVDPGVPAVVDGETFELQKAA